MNLKELKNEILSQYKYQIELHAHTYPVSGCSQVAPKDMVNIYKGLGYDGVVITNHLMYGYNGYAKEEYLDAFIADYKEAKKYGDEVGLKVYFGAEIRFTEWDNDYLIFGINEKMLSEIYDLLPYGIAHFRKNYAMPDSVFLQAHPMRDGMKIYDPSLLDGIEVFNLHPNHNSRVGMASAYAKEQDFPIVIAGSDFHHPNCNHEGMSALRSTCLPEDSFELAKILKDGDYLLEIGRNNIVIP